jgi:hypothetical protein
MSPDNREIARLLEEVLVILDRIIRILSRDERYAEVLRRVRNRIPVYVAVIDEELRQEVRAVSDRTTKMMNMLSQAMQQFDIIMKGQCPFCHEDLVTYVRNSELRLRCKKQTKSDCQKYAWVIGTATQVSPP